MTGIAGRHDTVEEIHAAGNALNNIAGRTNTHEIAGLILGHVGLNSIDDLIHHLGRLTHRQTADRIAITVDLRRLLHVPHTKIRKRCTLVNTKEHLTGVHRIGQGVEAIVLLLAPLQPAQCALAAQIGLDLHALLGTHENTVTIEVRGEGHSLLIDFTETGQRKHLKSAAVGKDRPIPVHKLMKTAHFTHHIITGAKMKMIRVAQLDLTPQLFLQIKGIHAALNSRLRAHIHEYGGLYVAAVSALKNTAARLSLFLDDFKHSCHLT